MNQSLQVLHFYFLFSLKDNKGRVIPITTNTVMRDTSILLNKQTQKKSVVRLPHV